MNENYTRRRIEASELARRRIDAGERTNPGTYRPVQKGRLNKKKFARAVIVFICLIIAGVVGFYYFSDRILPVFMQEDDTAPVKVDVQPEGNALADKLIVLDAGHGGFDIGATGISGVFEDDLNLKVAQYLKADLEENGARVVMTREDENAIAETKDEDMAKRRQIIQQSGSDIVVSIHMNSETESTYSGPVVLFMPGSVEGETLAKTIQQCLLTELKPETQTVARAEDLYITESGTQPCVLVECGFISNPEEEALLTDSGYQQKVAQAIVDGCRNYFSRD